MTLLETEGIVKTFGGLTALEHPDVAIEEGELVGLIGPNGAGKTTFFNCVTGVHPIDEGHVYFDGEEIQNRSLHEIARLGLVRTYQTSRELTTMTVEDNVMLPVTDHPGEEFWSALTKPEAVAEFESEVERRAAEHLERFDLLEERDTYASDLSGGKRKLLEIARALMLEPKLLMLDEPLAGVDPEQGRQIIEYIERLNDEGTTFVVIEHEIGSLASFVDRMVVLNQGEIIADGPPEDVLQDDRVIDVYLSGTDE